MLTLEQRKILATYGLQVASAFYGIEERKLRHLANKLCIQLPKSAQVSAATAELLKQVL